MKKDKLPPLFLAAGILLQTAVPALLGIFALIAMALKPSIIITRRAGVVIYLDWLFALLIILASTLHSGASVQSISYVLTFVSMYVLVRYAVAQITIDTIARVLYLIMVISLFGVIGELAAKYNGSLYFLPAVSFVFSDRNELGMYLAAGYISCLYLVRYQAEYNTVVNRSLLLVVPVLLVILASRSALAALFLGVLFSFNRGFKFYAVGLVVILFAFGLFALVPPVFLENFRLFNAESSVRDSDIIRWVLTSAAIGLFIENPVFGIGPNVFQAISGDFLEALPTAQVLDLSGGLATHNSYLQYFVELGMFMGLLIIYEIGRLFTTYIRYRSHAAYRQQQAQLRFIFSMAVVFMVSGAFINIHSSLFFMLAVFGVHRIIKRRIRPIVVMGSPPA